MEEYGKYFIIYGYVLPLAIMLVWLMWRVYSDLKAGEQSRSIARRMFSRVSQRWDECGYEITDDITED